MQRTAINLWFDGPDGHENCFENVPAATGDGEMYVPLWAVRKMLQYQWPANRWGIMFNAIDPLALPADKAPDLAEHVDMLSSEVAGDGE